jgi:transcriptional regulator with XRE-family HTH domain
MFRKENMPTHNPARRGIMETKKLVGIRIITLRKGRGYSQEKLAEVTGINAKYLSSIERGEENPTLDLFIRLSQSLKVDIHELFNIEYEGQPPQTLRKKLQTLLGEIKDQDLSRAIRILGMLVR